MSITSPPAPKELVQIDVFHTYVQSFLSDELPIIAIKCKAEQNKDTEFLNIEIRTSIFEKCAFNHCNFGNAYFIDVVFKSCDFSNSRFQGAYFERCQFICCKCVGVDMRDTVIKHTSFEQSNFQYSFFDKTKMTDVVFDHIDFTESSMTEATLKRFKAVGTKFVKNNFFKTMLATVDFTDDEFIMPIVSAPPVELKGAIINMFQAADLIGLCGVIVSRQ